MTSGSRSNCDRSKCSVIISLYDVGFIKRNHVWLGGRLRGKDGTTKHETLKQDSFFPVSIFIVSVCYFKPNLDLSQ